MGKMKADCWLKSVAWGRTPGKVSAKFCLERWVQVGKGRWTWHPRGTAFTQRHVLRKYSSLFKELHAAQSYQANTGRTGSAAENEWQVIEGHEKLCRDRMKGNFILRTRNMRSSWLKDELNCRFRYVLPNQGKRWWRPFSYSRADRVERRYWISDIWQEVNLIGLSKRMQIWRMREKGIMKRSRWPEMLLELVVETAQSRGALRPGL
jgi:hypothetical protein